MTARNREIRIRGARQHNLANIDVSIPRECLVVLTGVSGSGKSTLAFDTVYADAQRRFVESISTSARQFLEQTARPDVDSIEGLSPAIAIEQKRIQRSPRSTVATLTEIHDFLRVLFARVASPWCDTCSRPVKRHSPQSVARFVQGLEEQTKVQLLAPIVSNQKGAHKKVIAELRKAGFVRLRIDGEIVLLEDDISLDAKQPHTVDVVVDRLVSTAEMGNRLVDSIELSFRTSDGRIIVLTEAPSGETEEQLFSERFICETCDLAVPEVEPRLFSFNSPYGACQTCQGLGMAEDESPCLSCEGTRIRAEARVFRLSDTSLPELLSLPISDACLFFQSLSLTETEIKMSEQLIAEIYRRLGFLETMGLGYVALDRRAASLSGGELQRIRLASQIGAGLSGVLYVLDEPTVGLHQRDTERLLHSLLELRDQQNSVLVVEHDVQTIMAADYVIDLGPGAGKQGGQIVAQGPPAEFIKNEQSLTAAFLSGRKDVYAPNSRRCLGSDFLTLKGARLHNLKDVTLSIPLHTFTCVTGVSGSGKSSLIEETLRPAVAEALQKKRSKKKVTTKNFDSIEGEKKLDSLLTIDQSAIGASSRSTPATYVGLFDPLRALYARLPEARARGYSAGRFSYNVKGGRCEQCQGMGSIQVEMHFLPDVFVDCPECQGSRYNKDTLDIRYKGFSIAEVLAMSIEEANQQFAAVPEISPKLQRLAEVGLGYLSLGQSSTTLSGGEAQRVKLAGELAKRRNGHTLYLLDEPTSGLHPADVDNLLQILHRLVDEGNTVVVVEHNLDVIAGADWCIDLGPDGGEEGGMIVAQGTPETIAACESSHTGVCLQNFWDSKGSE